ncbi:MAG: sugar phosphate nucleotidyltransferase [Planctomycetia bacterium]|nr:sugar phosphate nucleotidyltransferase [Planctomycetia bacterium]
MLNSVYGLILAGGFGTRLWPLSQPSRPKPFLKLLENGTLFAQTIKRLQTFLPMNRIFVSSGNEMQNLILETESNFPCENIFIEPCSRNTAPAIGLAAIRLMKTDPEALMVVLPSDQLIEPVETFTETLLNAITFIQKNPQSLLTLGILPTFASTDYGYIKASNQLACSFSNKEKTQKNAHCQNNNGSIDISNGFSEKDILNQTRKILNVDTFYEKPSLEKAKDYFQSGHYFWNAGIFVWKARTIFELLCQFEPELGQRLQNIQKILKENGQIMENQTEFFRSEFSQMQKISIDYAVLEKASQVVVLPVSFRWDDLGTFQALDRNSAQKKDENGNLVQGTKLIAQNATNNIILGQEKETNKKRIVLIGVHDLIVVQTSDLTLIVPKENENQIKNLLDSSQEKDFLDYL